MHQILCFLFFFFQFSLAQFPLNCEQFPDDPACQMSPFSAQRGNNLGHPSQLPCKYQDLWLIPGKSDTSCTRKNAQRLVEVDTKHIRIHPPVIKFPGCFTVEIRNVHILDGQTMSNSIFAKSEYQWLNVRGSENSKCQNSSMNGCGGFGNNCYYCDICESLKIIGDQRPSGTQNGGIPSGIAEQLQGMNCPKEAGLYTFRKQFCFNDWSWLDNDGDCRLDFLAGADEQNGLREAMAALQQVGYGTVVAKIHLAYNATPEKVRKKLQKEAQIERIGGREIEQKRREWKGTAGAFEEYKRWQLERKKGQWHAQEYLPWLLYENEFACIRLTFDVCERSPQQRWDGSSGFTCI